MLDRKSLRRGFLLIGPFGFVFTAVSVLYLCWTWSDGLGDYGGDNASYLLIAKYFSPWGEASIATEYFATHSLYPPFYSLLLSVSGGAESMLAAHLVTTTFLLGSFAVFYLWMRVLDFPRLLSCLAVLLFALLPGTYMQTLSILSENLYLLLALGGIAAIAAYERNSRSQWLWIAALCISAVPLTRSAGLSLCGAYVLYLLWHRPRWYAVFIAISMLPWLTWSALQNRQSAGYVSVLLGNYGADPMSALQLQLQNQFTELWNAWIWTFSGTLSSDSVVALATIVCLSGTAVRFWRFKLDALYVVSYLALILIWPFPAEATRFVFAIVPFVLVHGLVVLSKIPKIDLGGYRLGALHLLLTALFIVALPNLALTAERYFEQPSVSGLTAKRERAWYLSNIAVATQSSAYNQALVSGASKLSSLVAKDECIYSIKPSLVGLYADRISVVPPPHRFDDSAFQKALAVDDCRYFFMIALVSPSYTAKYYPLDKLNPTLRILDVTTAAGFDEPVTILAERIK